MKIAFVNQPIDTILPPYQTSVGACTYGVAKALARSCEVVVYGLQDRHGTVDETSSLDGIHFRFIPSERSDRLLWSIRSQMSTFVRLHSPASSSHWTFPSFGRKVAEDLQQQKCDVIHLQHCSQYVPVIRALNPRAKLVLHLHAEWFSQNGSSVLERRLRQVDLVTAVSDFVRDKVRRSFPFVANRCETTYNGVDSDDFSRNRTEFIRPSPIKRILYSGAVSPHKGIHVLLEAFKVVLKRHPHTQLDIVGFQGNYGIEETFDLKDTESLKAVKPYYAKHYVSRLKAKAGLGPAEAGTYIAYLKERAADISDRVAFLGFVPRPELLDRYFSAHVFAFPPIWDEGFGIPPVEAMAAGVPVVASRSGALPETVQHKHTGLLVPRNDSSALAEALLELLGDDARRESMGLAARQRALTTFTWQNVARDMRARYDVLCERTSAVDA